MENGYQMKIMQIDSVTVQMLAQPIRAQWLQAPKLQNCIIKVCEIKTVGIGRASGLTDKETLIDMEILLLHSRLSNKGMEAARVDSEITPSAGQSRIDFSGGNKTEMKRVEFTALISSQSLSHTSKVPPDNNKENRVVVTFPSRQKQ